MKTVCLNVASVSLGLVAFLALALPAAAQGSRPDSLALSCDQVQATIARQGSVVIGTGPNVYDRFVSDARFCGTTQYARQDFIRTQNTRYCLVYVCKDRSLFWEP
jgi:hypothetical protein